MRGTTTIALLTVVLGSTGCSDSESGNPMTGGAAGASGGAAGASGGTAGASGGRAGSGGGAGTAGGPSCEPTGGQHTFDLAARAPAQLSIMFSMSWFGIPASDRNGPGPDPGWGNWKWGAPPCIDVNDPNTCEDVNGSQQRAVAASHHPLAGIYSASARDPEGLSRVDLMLSILRRACDPGARVDAWTVQMNSVKLSSAHTAPDDPKFAISADLAYRALLGFLDRAEAQRLYGRIVPGFDTTWYWHFGDGKGITTHEAKLAALEDDIVDVARLANERDGAMKINCRPLLYFYTGGTSTGPYISVQDWTGVLDRARQRLGIDFYAIGATTNPAFFEVFDGIAPWLQSSVWNSAQGATVRERAQDWTARRHDGVLGALEQWPGRIVMGGVAPGFDDYTQNWGACTDRNIPRDPGVLQGQFDYFESERTAGHPIRGMILETWDDWTEGSQFEPSVEEGLAKLVQLSELTAAYQGEAFDASDTRLRDRWTNFGQPRNCSSDPVVVPPPIDLACP